jgi:tagatose-1,6-bisphosphate aldolase non-catalytic subunit AgaZ/GatZ
MNSDLRNRAKAHHQPLMDFILYRIKELEKKTGIRRTIFAACPNSISVIKAALRSAKRCDSPIKFAATLNQVDTDYGYTGLNQQEFVNTIRSEARKINLKVPVIIAIDHGGPWLKDKHRLANLTFDETFAEVKKSFEAAVAAGFDLIHVDPTIDINLPAGAIIPIELVAARTVELIDHTEQFRQANGYSQISYEVGTEEVHGGLADIKIFNRFLELLKSGLNEKGLTGVWPCFVVGKVGTDLHTTTFDPETAKKLTAAASAYGSVIKGHYTDNVTNPYDYPLSGIGAANIGPEFTECEYDGLMELEDIEKKLFDENSIPKLSLIRKTLWNEVIASGRWKKWLQTGENPSDFYSVLPQRQEWLIKTGCRYIWQNPEVIASRSLLYDNLQEVGIHTEDVVLSHIERAMNKYFYQFNLTGLNALL